ncbi:MAG: transcription termination/antitermination factor NusG [Elusimicrobia bacterium RIFOXYA12_FULL_51_18]|nr:MAG: transcription termination/antitermination factor NusG [Elusimicrobia bacterium RIFOXYA12_FULL_51_18]OGS31534.1 MAG: transcription termination/antitermination factor NusG [Elusimicrobia bacterium RIFOXYA2_FULL_53_38]
MAKGWYVIHTRTGFEERVNKMLQHKLDTNELTGKLFQVLIPTEDIIQVKHNKKVVSKRKFFPGYVLANIELDNQTYWAIRGIQGVSGFLGDPKPAPMEESEVQQILELVNSAGLEKPKPAVQFEKGENVRIIEGPFKHFMGVVEEVNEQKAKIKVIVTVFDRPTPVELDFLQVEKV